MHYPRFSCPHTFVCAHLHPQPSNLHQSSWSLKLPLSPTPHTDHMDPDIELRRRMYQQKLCFSKSCLERWGDTTQTSGRRWWKKLNSPSFLSSSRTSHQSPHHELFQRCSKSTWPLWRHLWGQANGWACYPRGRVSSVTHPPSFALPPSLASLMFPHFYFPGIKL